MILDRLRGRMTRLALQVLSAAACVLPVMAHAEALFFQQIKPGTFSFPIYFQAGATNEIAEDIPFTGTQQLSSFTFGYKASVPVRVTFRFYGVDGNTELLGAKLVEIVREFPAGEDTPTVTLAADEQFAFPAQPNLYPGNDAYANAVAPRTGGWTSVTFATLDGSPLPSDIGFRMAQPTVSYPYLLDVATGKQTGLSDANGSLPQGMYLQLRSSVSTDVPVPTVAAVLMSPPSVKAGTQAKATYVLSSQVPFEGTVVKLKSSNPKVASVPSESLATTGFSTGTVSVTTGARVRKTEVVTITAEANGSTASVALTVTP